MVSGLVVGKNLESVIRKGFLLGSPAPTQITSIPHCFIPLGDLNWNALYTPTKRTKRNCEKEPEHASKNDNSEKDLRNYSFLSSVPAVFGVWSCRSSVWLCFSHQPSQTVKLGSARAVGQRKHCSWACFKLDVQKNLENIYDMPRFSFFLRCQCWTENIVLFTNGS